MDLTKLLAEEYTLLYQQQVDGNTLAVKETAQYRWFEYGGESVQSLMSRTSPEQIMMPVYQSLLLFILWHNKPLNVLNLGLGGASIERALATVEELSLTSVDASQPIIDMAKDYFKLPLNVDVVCQKAEQFIVETKQQYDVILCDLFIGERSPQFLLTQAFYAQLKTISTTNAVVMVNLQADTDEQLLHAIVSIKRYFPYVALIEFDDYINIVIVASSHEIPSKALLQQRLTDFKQIDFTCLDKAIEKMRYIPYTKP